MQMSFWQNLLRNWNVILTKLKIREDRLYFESFTLKWKCHFDKIFISGCAGSCQNDNFWYAVSDENFVKMMTFPFQVWNWNVIDKIFIVGCSGSCQWQFLVQSAMKILSKWHLHFSVSSHDWPSVLSIHPMHLHRSPVMRKRLWWDVILMV